jgi:uncharacterized membrane protein YgaE (UPF0421/DUF939 family)
MAPEDKSVGLVASVLGCTAAAAIAYGLASVVGLPHPLWACIFALIASQGSLANPLSAMGGRVVGTILGVAVTIAVNAAISRWAIDFAWQMLVDVAICAAIIWRRPAIQACLWTPPIVLMTAAPGESIVVVGVSRGCEVILGVVIGGLLHMAAQKASGWARSPRWRRDQGAKP